MKRSKSTQSGNSSPMKTRTVENSNCENKGADCEFSIVDPMWQNIDPNPDIRALFAQFDEKFFEKRLTSVEVKWSPRMTLCAGMCVYEGRGGLCSHEMIHAYLFVTENNRDRDGHGPNFRAHMNRINKIAKTNIT
ncbi:unnamed protein product, partial [Dibothriocephalus latus]